MADRYEVSVIVGPCSEEEVEALMVTIIELPEAKAIGAAVASVVFGERDG